MSAGILISETGDQGQSDGNLSLISKMEFNVDYLPKDSVVSSGDIVVTSGTGGIFPPNLKVGTVISVKTDFTGLSLNAVCRPMLNLSNLKNILVLTDFNGKESKPSVGGK